MGAWVTVGGAVLADSVKAVRIDRRTDLTTVHAQAAQ
jgi:hypothetical protein